MGIVTRSTHTDAQAHTHTCTLKSTCVQAGTRAHTHTSTHTSTHKNTHTHITHYTPTHEHTHTHTHTHTPLLAHTPSFPKRSMIRTMVVTSSSQEAPFPTGSPHQTRATRARRTHALLSHHPWPRRHPVLVQPPHSVCTWCAFVVEVRVRRAATHQSAMCTVSH